MAIVVLTTACADAAGPTEPRALLDAMRAAANEPTPALDAIRP